MNEYKTTEEIRKAYIFNGWNNPTFEEVHERNIYGKDIKLYKMTSNGNLYDTKGNIYRFNIKAKGDTRL